MGEFRLLAHPLSVNLLVLVRLILYFSWRNRGIQISERQLLFVGIFALAFGFGEAVVAIRVSRFHAEASHAH
jgi:hypothetical protein